MRARTEAEVKAYADGYKACYKEFCQCLKNNTAEQAIKKMGVFVVVVDNCVEVAEQTEPITSGVVWTEEAIKNEPKSYATWASTEPTGRRGEMMSQKEFDEMVHRVVSGQTEPKCEECEHYGHKVKRCLLNKCKYTADTDCGWK